MSLSTCLGQWLGILHHLIARLCSIFPHSGRVNCPFKEKCMPTYANMRGTFVPKREYLVLSLERQAFDST